MAGVIVKSRSRILHGHDWVFGSEIQKVHGSPQDGDVISIQDSHGKPLGSGTYSSQSHISVRRFSRKRQDLDREFFLRRITQAWEHRLRNGLTARPCRVVWSESDGLPGLVVDRYGNVAVLQTLTLAMDLRRETIGSCLLELLGPDGVKTIIERNEGAGRTAEGLEPRTGLIAGEPVFSHHFQMGGVEFEADLLHGQKTGFYLDQFSACEEMSPFAKERRVLDCFANQGGFALTCAKAGATSVVAVESGEEPVARLRENAARNNLEIRILRRDVFEYLRSAQKGNLSFDLVILDPPSFTRGRSNLAHAIRGYRELHLRAAHLLAPGGLLATFSCSHHVGWEAFIDSANTGLAGAGKSGRILKRFDQPVDHPILLNIPETGYLKGLLIELIPGR